MLDPIAGRATYFDGTMMRYIGISQEEVVNDPSLKKLDLVDIVILDCMRQLSYHCDPKYEVVGDDIWRYAPWWMVLEAIPLLRDSNGKPWKIQEINRRLKKMEKCEAIHIVVIGDIEYYMFHWGKVKPPEPEKPLKGKRKIVYDRDGHKCLKCGIEGDRNLVMDHVMPLAKGGNSKICNLQTLCYGCNHKKGTDYIDYRSIQVPIEDLYIVPPIQK